jgi:hypothetical protein
MAGEGSMMGAIQSLKNNRALRKNNRGKWKDLVGNNIENPIEDHIRASPELLLEIRTRLQKENQLQAKKAYIKLMIFIVFFIISFYLFNKYWIIITSIFD